MQCNIALHNLTAKSLVAGDILTPRLPAVILFDHEPTGPRLSFNTFHRQNVLKSDFSGYVLLLKSLSSEEDERLDVGLVLVNNKTRWIRLNAWSHVKITSYMHL